MNDNLNDMNKREYTTNLYIEIGQYIAFIRALRCYSDYKFVGVTMCYDRCYDGICRHFGTLRVTIKFRTEPCNYGLCMFHIGKTFQRELADER